MKKKKLSVGRALSTLFPLMFKHVSFLILPYGILTLIVAALSGATVYTNQIFFDSLVETISENRNWEHTIMCALLALLVILLAQILGRINGFLWVYLGDKLELSLIYEYNKKISEIPAVYFEDPIYLQDLEKARDGIYGAIGMFATTCEIVLYFGGYFVTTGLYLFRIQPVLLGALILVFIPTAIVTFLQSKMYAKEADEVVALRRQIDSYTSAALNYRETRLFGAFGYFYERILATQKAIFSLKWKTENKNCKIQLALNLCKLLGWCGIVFLMLYELINSHITVGVYAAVYTSMSAMFGNCEAMFSRIKVDISENLGMIENYICFLQNKCGCRKKTNVDLSEGIRVSNVSFTYPGSVRKAIDGINLSILPGETIAIVGANGSGKTTLAKIICGIYEPNEGQVYIGGVDSSTVEKNALFAKTSAVFQNYVRYSALTAYENVSISDYAKNDKCDIPFLSNIDPLTLANGYNTILSRDFGGAELSGGEWQRLAMARGIYRSHELILLDEPTAALDPLEESRLYKEFAKIAQDKTCILITHRLGSARIADRIFVMDQGCLVECGTHKQLISRDGLYADMWNANASYYQ